MKRIRRATPEDLHKGALIEVEFIGKTNKNVCYQYITECTGSTDLGYFYSFECILVHTKYLGDEIYYEPIGADFHYDIRFDEDDDELTHFYYYLGEAKDYPEYFI